MPSPIVLLTDFGQEDHYVGVLKGVIARITPEAPIIDLCHEVPPQDIRAGAYLLGISYRFFPKGSIFLSVVDPGVGTDRKLVIAHLGSWYFVNPDNGLLTFVQQKESLKQVVQITNDRYWLSPVSSTFHGRDIMAPVSGHLSKTKELKKFGVPLRGFLRTLPVKSVKKGRHFIEGEVVSVDHFGNLITNIEAEWISKLRSCEVHMAHKKISRIARSYANAARGEWVAVVASADLLEIAINQGSAQKEIHAKVGDPVRITY